RSPRRLLALCSPITHVMASATLLLPQPFGPTIAVTPLSKASSARSENDLKPLISSRSRRMVHTLDKFCRHADGRLCRRETRMTRPRPQAGGRVFFWLGSRFGNGPIRALSRSDAERGPGAAKTVVSLTRPSYCGKVIL